MFCTSFFPSYQNSWLQEIQGYFCSVFIVSNNCYGKSYENWAYMSMFSQEIIL